MKRKLRAINAMLASIAQLPVSSVTSTNAYVLAAVHTLDRINEEVQEHGYWFNTDKNVTLIPDNDKLIRLDESVLRVHDNISRMNFVVRDNMLYNPVQQSFKFSEPLLVDIVVLLDFEEVPPSASAYITRKAVEEFFIDRDGEQIKAKKYIQDTFDAFKALNAESIRQLGISAADSPHFAQFTGRLSRTIGIQAHRYNTVPRVWAKK